MRINEFLILLVTSVITAIILELSILSSNLENNINKKNLFYISHALTSCMCGLLLALMVMTMSDDIIFWIISDMIGVFLGKGSFKIAYRFLLNFFKFLNTTEMSELLKDEEKNEKDKKNKDT